MKMSVTYIDDRVTGIASTTVKCSLHSNGQKYVISFRILKPLRKGLGVVEPVTGNGFLNLSLHLPGCYIINENNE